MSEIREQYGRLYDAYKEVIGINEKEGASLPYLKQLEKQLDAAVTNLRSSLNMSGEVVSPTELKLMNRVKDLIKYLYDLVEGNLPSTGKRKY